MNEEPTTSARAIVLALAGDSASGKSTLSRGIAGILGADRVRVISADDYHRFDRRTRSEMSLTPLAPEANRPDLLARDLRALASGQTITKPTYDHATGSFGPDEVVAPAEVVIVEGLLPLADRATRDAIDVGVFLEPEEIVRRRWKLERDVFERGYMPNEVIAELRRREPDAASYVRPQRDLADVVVRFHRRRPSRDHERLSARLVVRPTLPFPGLRELVGSMRTRGAGRRAHVRWSTRTDRRGPMSVLDVDDDCPPEVGAELEDVFWTAITPDDRMRSERIGIVRQPGREERRSEALAVSQLLIVSHLLGTFDAASVL